MLIVCTAVQSPTTSPERPQDSQHPRPPTSSRESLDPEPPHTLRMHEIVNGRSTNFSFAVVWGSSSDSVQSSGQTSGKVISPGPPGHCCPTYLCPYIHYPVNIRGERQLLINQIAPRMYNEVKEYSSNLCILGPYWLAQTGYSSDH